MNRLTRRLFDGRPDCAYCNGAFNDFGKCSNDCELWEKQLERLAEYEDAEEQGRMIIRPDCKGCKHEDKSAEWLPCCDCYGCTFDDKGFYYEAINKKKI